MTNQSKAGSWFSAKKIISAVIALLILVSMFATPAFAESINSYKVNLIVDNEAITVTTNETEPIEILKDAGYAISNNDKMDITSFEEGVGGKIVVQKLKEINIEQNAKIDSYEVYASTVGDALKEAGVVVNSSEMANYDNEDKVVNGMVISIKEAFQVNLIADGNTISKKVIDGTVMKIVTEAGIQLGKDDYTTPSLDSIVDKETNIEVFRVEYKSETVNEAIPYSTQRKNDSSLVAGTSKVVRKGQYGSKRVTYNVKYVNGTAVSKDAINTVVTSNPVTEIVNVGISPFKPNGVKSKKGVKLNQKFSGRYTHYCVCKKCCGNAKGITASGRRIKNGMANPYYVACNWLPLGSVIKVGNTYYTVVDRGGKRLSKKGRIDIFTPEGHKVALKKGTGKCTITVVRLGW